MKNGNTRPWLLWSILWFISPVLIALRNQVVKGSGDVGFGSVLIFAAIMGIVWVIIALIGWFFIKLIYKSVSGGRELLLQHAFVIWLILFLLMFLFPLFKQT